MAESRLPSAISVRAARSELFRTTFSRLPEIFFKAAKLNAQLAAEAFGDVQDSKA